MTNLEKFQERMKTELEFCQELFNYATIRLLAMKYTYYVLSEEIVKDATYDCMEKDWHIMGQALGLLREDETSPCVDWDASHPLASKAIELALKLPRRPID